MFLCNLACSFSVHPERKACPWRTLKMSKKEKVITRTAVDDDCYCDPRLASDTKPWLNARSDLARKVIKHLRDQGEHIPAHDCEFVIGCAAPFRTANQVGWEQMEAIVREMAKMYREHQQRLPQEMLALASSS